MFFFLLIIVNQSDLEENKTNEVFQTSPLTTTNTITTKKPVDDLLLLDLDPLGSIENNNFNNNNEENNEDRLERLKQDLQELYASSTVIDSIPITEQIPTLPDIIDQQDELSLPLAVKQLELEVQREILQHTLEEPTQSSSPPPLPLSSSPLLVSDLTTLPNDNSDDQKENVFFSTSFEEEEEEEEEQKEENISSIPVIEEIEQTSNNLIFQNESDLIPSETSSTQNTSILHSVDSIVNAPMASNFEVQKNNNNCYSILIFLFLFLIYRIILLLTHQLLILNLYKHQLNFFSLLVMIVIKNRFNHFLMNL